MKTYQFQKIILGKPVEAIVNDTGYGINVTLAGGDKGHIGAVSVKYPGETLVSHQFPTHREGVVSDKWALTLEDALGVAVSVSAGVHYDGIGKEEIGEILASLDTLLAEVVAVLAS